MKKGSGGVPFIVSWEDAGEAFRLGLEIELDRLPSRCEIFFISGDMPQGKFLNEKTRRILGFKPQGRPGLPLASGPDWLPTLVPWAYAHGYLLAPLRGSSPTHGLPPEK